MAELSISITQPVVSGNQPVPTDIVTDFVVQDTVTNVTTTETVADSIISEVTPVSAPTPDIAVSAEAVGGMSIPTTTLFTRGLDQVLINETFSIAATYRKIFIEQQHIADNYRVVYFGKVYADTVPFTDVLAKYLTKITADVYSVQDITYLQPVKVIHDQVVKTDQSFVTIGKGKHETLVTSDSYSYLINYHRAFTDYIDATDDFFGEANIDDDQVASFGKNTVDYVYVQSVQYVDFSTIKSDSYTVTDTNTLGVTKPFFSITSNSDTSKYDFGKAVNNTSLVADLNLIAVNKVLEHAVLQQDVSSALVDKQLTEFNNAVDITTLSVDKLVVNSLVSYDTVITVLNSVRIFSDTSTTTDLHSFNFTNVKTDTSRITDQASKSNTKPFTSEFSLSDGFSYIAAYSRNFQDTVNSTDDFFGEANIDDDQVASFGKNVLEYITLSETVAFDSTKQFADTFSLADPVSLYAAKVLSSEFTKADEITIASIKISVVSISLTELTTSDIGKVQLDSFQVYDPVSVNITKPLPYINIVAVDYVGLNTSKVFYDVYTNTDIISFGNTKVFEDLAVLVDIVNKYSNKITTDNNQIVDVSTINFDKTLNTLLVNTETINIGNTKVLESIPAIVDYITIANSKTISDTNQIADLSTLTAIKTINSSTNSITDDFNLVAAYNRNFIDTINSTDDFFGEANIDDDQIVRFGKNIVEYTLPNDNISFDLAFTILDTYAVLDPIYINTSKVLTSESNNNDLVSLSVNKQASEVLSITELLNVFAAKNILDSSTISSTVSKDITKELANSFINSDTYSLAINKTLNFSFITSELTNFYITKQFLDTLSAVETVKVSTDKSLSDTAIHSDTVSKASSKQVLDDFASTEIPYINAGKVTLDILYTADVLTFLKYTGPVLFENLSVADSGFINNQSYFAGTYVEPGYVGTNTNFT